jgi:predicted Fe-S protein YdhL (DUF1289 family)
MDKPATKPLIDTPCIGVCSTVYGDTVCRGCKRFYREVISWNTFNDEAKQQVYERLSSLMSQVLSQFLDITNTELLQQQLQQHSIRYNRTDDAFAWAHHLLRVGADRIKDVKSYGIEIKPEFRHLNLPELFTLIDEKLYEVSCQVYHT